MTSKISQIADEYGLTKIDRAILRAVILDEIKAIAKDANVRGWEKVLLEEFLSINM